MPTDNQIIEALGGDLSAWAQQCHAASIRLVKSGILPAGSRVARGAALGVPGQHSWVVVNTKREERVNVYARDLNIIDPTLWSYDERIEGVWRDKTKHGRYTPHGAGSIWSYGAPQAHGGEIISFDGWSTEAELFLKMVGPLDLAGWRELVHFPMEGWPSNEILTRLDGDKRISPFIPIDILGNATDLNPDGLYLA